MAFAQQANLGNLNQKVGVSKCVQSFPGARSHKESHGFRTYVHFTLDGAVKEFQFILSILSHNNQIYNIIAVEIQLINYVQEELIGFLISPLFL